MVHGPKQRNPERSMSIEFQFIRKCLKLYCGAADSTRRNDTIEAFNDFVSKEKISSVVTYLDTKKTRFKGALIIKM